jgi:Zn-dependent peptidase ImmA (M78 family)/transcriptional regulator with XRE-family HTH domain
MPASVPALVNPPLLVWAREQSGYDPEPVAKRLKVKKERLLAWERGEDRPTLRQAQALAKMYHRPFGIFFLPQPPTLPPLASEYRHLPGVRPGVESPELRLAIRVMSLRRDAAIDLSAQLGVSIPAFPLEGHLSEGADSLGVRVRVALGVSIEEQLTWDNDWQALRRWRTAVESAGALVFQFPKVGLGEARGLSLLEFPLPAIGINSKETSPSARIFTLVHEFIHLALAAGREEHVALRESRSENEWRDIEHFAEETASAVLIPEATLSPMLAHVSHLPERWTVEAVSTLARKFKVTPLAMATRLRARRTLTWAAYNVWCAEWKAFLESLPPRRKGFATPVTKTLGRAGKPFSRLVVHAMDANRITAVDASRLLDLGFGHFDKLRDALRKGPGSERTPETE